MVHLARSIGLLVLIAAFVASPASVGAMGEEPSLIVPDVLAAKDPKITYRLDILSGKLDPIDRRDLKVGYVYYHYSSRLNGWAWSYYQDDHSFWHAYGEGTTQIARCFDIRASREEIAQRLKEYPELAKNVERYNESVCLRLLADGRWKIIGVGRAPSIFDVETGERWQKFSKDQYIPVVHANGRTWTVRDGSYYPSNSSFAGE
jgi:hypothetical protein